MKKIFLVTAILFSLPAFGAWTSGVQVSEIIAEGNEGGSSLVIVFSTSVSSGDTGATCTGRYHYLDASTEKGKLIFSMLLTAKASESNVKVSLSQGGSASRCTISGLKY